ncbi:hypothetical protein SELMODRAFT_403570 [Selaginella moellendorffii]|uniref:Uncharacterized protein n=1 Tax=Selaginella moellendorffii TaxID=88036 RepID=D8QRU2_SELML|nr:hypothetical protein SELMODRAFT_403570 [Selaginella moellendorffii]
MPSFIIGIADADQRELQVTDLTIGSWDPIWRENYGFLSLFNVISGISKTQHLFCSSNTEIEKTLSPSELHLLNELKMILGVEREPKQRNLEGGELSKQQLSHSGFNLTLEKLTALASRPFTTEDRCWWFQTLTDTTDGWKRWKVPKDDTHFRKWASKVAWDSYVADKADRLACDELLKQPGFHLATVERCYTALFSSMASTVQMQRIEAEVIEQVAKRLATRWLRQLKRRNIIELIPEDTKVWASKDLGETMYTSQTLLHGNWKIVHGGWI